MRGNQKALDVRMKTRMCRTANDGRTCKDIYARYFCPDCVADEIEFLHVQSLMSGDRKCAAWTVYGFTSIERQALCNTCRDRKKRGLTTCFTR